jgi:2,4-dienoyl-CoA reductase-like NADH-dependent reductase (Old Yellow Enzyme family)
MRLLLAVYDTIKKRLGKKVPVMVKINCDDFSPSGFTIKDSIRVASALCERGLHAVEISGGGVGREESLRARAFSLDKRLSEASFAGYAKKIRETTRPMPMALVNGIRSLSCMETIVEKDLADLVSMSRPFIREPDLVKKLEAGQKKATCTSCGACISEKVFSKMMLRCHLD